MKTAKGKIIFDLIKSRRTIRDFKSTLVPKKDIIKIIDAARYAPTTGNIQPWKFVIIQDRKQLNSLCELLQDSIKKTVAKMTELNDELRLAYLKSSQEAIREFMKVPVFILVFVNTTTYPEFVLYDGCLAIENLMLAAHALGYGTAFYTSYFPEKEVKQFVNASKHHKFICAIPLGIPKKLPKAPTKKLLKEFIVFDRFK
jgi:nitroreductase